MTLTIRLNDKAQPLAVGQSVADLLAARMGETFKVHKKSGAEVTTGRLGGRSVVLAKPRTYMNESGRQVGPLAKFYSVAAEDVIVVHDELDIPPGQLRLKFGGGLGGAQRPEGHPGASDDPRFLAAAPGDRPSG